jgi:hypothetical protein
MTTLAGMVNDLRAAWDPKERPVFMENLSEWLIRTPTTPNQPPR